MQMKATSGFVLRNGGKRSGYEGVETFLMSQPNDNILREIVAMPVGEKNVGLHRLWSPEFLRFLYEVE